MGWMDRLSLIADWKRLGSQPVQVLIDSLYVTIEPRITDFTVDEV
jgi:hypothetical protein